MASNFKPSGHDGSTSLLSVRVLKIMLQPDKYKPVSMKPVELETVRLKRARVDMVVQDGQKESKLAAIVEFRGSALTLSRSEGDCDVEEVGNRLGMEYYKRYGKDALKIIGKTQQDGSVCEWTLADPTRFVDFLHLIKNRKVLETYRSSSDLVEHMSPKENSSSVGNAYYASKELVEQAYAPLRKDAVSWLNPTAPTHTFGAWSNLETEKPYLIPLVHEDIAEIFSRAKTANNRLSSLNVSLFGIYDKANTTAREKLNLTARPGNVQPPQVMFRILSGPSFLGGVWLQGLWASGKTLKQYATDFVNTNYPGTEWELDLQIDGYTMGDHNLALRFAGAAQSYLRHESKAVELQQVYGELMQLGLDAQRRIDVEMRKLVRLKG